MRVLPGPGALNARSILSLSYEILKKALRFQEKRVKMVTSAGSGEPGRPRGRRFKSNCRKVGRGEGGSNSRDLGFGWGVEASQGGSAGGQNRKAAAVFHGSGLAGDGRKRGGKRRRVRIPEVDPKVHGGRTGRVSVLRRKRTGGLTSEGPLALVGSGFRKRPATRQGDETGLRLERAGVAVGNNRGRGRKRPCWDLETGKSRSLVSLFQK